MCEHVIGLWDESGDTRLMKLNDLRGEINQYNKFLNEENENDLKEHGIFKRNINDYLYGNQYEFFKPFNYCPLCGKKIDWKGMRENATK